MSQNDSTVPPTVSDFPPVDAYDDGASEPSIDTPPESQAPADAEKDPDDWVTGDEAMTGPQASYLETLCRKAGVDFDPNLTKAEASKRIDELQESTGRGADS